MVWDLWCFEFLDEKDHWLDQLINDGGVCRTAPATQGLLIMQNLPDWFWHPVPGCEGDQGQGSGQTQAWAYWHIHWVPAHGDVGTYVYMYW